MVSQFKKVLEKTILPQFPEVSYVDVSQFGFGDFYRVRYYLNRKWDDNVRPVALMNETVSLFKWMSPDKNSDIFVEMKDLEDEDI